MYVCLLTIILSCSCKNGGRRQGNMGHLMHIINIVYKHCQETADVLMILQDCKFCIDKQYIHTHVWCVILYKLLPPDNMLLYHNS